MRIHFEAKGPISNVLKSFKSDFLGKLAEEDLEREVRLVVEESDLCVADEDGSASLRRRILEVLADEQEEP